MPTTRNWSDENNEEDVGLLAVIVILSGFAISASDDESLKSDLAIVDVRIYTAPDVEPIEDGNVVIRVGKWDMELIAQTRSKNMAYKGV